MDMSTMHLLMRCAVYTPCPISITIPTDESPSNEGIGSLGRSEEVLSSGF